MKAIIRSAGLVVTGNLKIIPDSRIRNIVYKVLDGDVPSRPSYGVYFSTYKIC